MKKTISKKVMDFLDYPTTKIAKYASFFMMAIIYLSVLNTVIYEKYSSSLVDYKVIFDLINYVVLFVFTMDLVLRIVFTQNKIKYFTSFYGIIDILSVVPELLSLFIFPNISSPTWLRVFKIFRILKVIKIFKFVDGITGKLIPFIAMAIAYKGVIIMFEQELWWPNTKDLSIVIAVVGFSLSVLLGTKLNVVNNRIYQIEDAVCRIVGSLRDMQYNINIQKELIQWSLLLEKTLKYNKENKEKVVNDMRLATDRFEMSLENAGIGGPNTANFHRDVAYLLHRTLAKTPINYEKFLKTIVFIYVSIVILVVPGITGLFSSSLLVIVLGGMYFLIEDMDSPLSYESDSFIDVKLDALELYNKNFNISKKLT